MNKKLMLIFYFALLSGIEAQTWQVFTNGDLGIPETSITALAEDKEGIIWAGTANGILKYDGTNWEKFDTTNTPLTAQFIWTVTIDSFNNKWFGTFADTAGLIKYDNQNWTVYNVKDYGLNGSAVFSIAIDSNNNLWMGTYWDGLAMFDTGNLWKVYNHTNSGLLQPQEEINCVVIDDSNHLWYGSDGWGAGSFDLDSTWEYFTNFTVIDPVVFSISIDGRNNKWFGGVESVSMFIPDSGWRKFDYSNEGEWYYSMVTDTNKSVWFASTKKGLLKLDYSQGEKWIHVFPPGYPVLQNEGCGTLIKDKTGNLWIGYNNGYIAVFNPGGIVSVKNKNGIVPTTYQLYQNYPNPFNPTTEIKYQIKEPGFVSLKVFDILGKEVATLVDEHKNPGHYSVTFDASSVSGGLPSGVYIYKLQAGEFSSVKKMLLTK